MAGRTSRFQVIPETEDLPPPPPPAPPAAAPAPPAQRVLTLEILSLLLSTLSQRTALWLGANLVPLAIVGIGAALWSRALPDPSVNQLIALGLYGAFGLALILATRK